MSEYLTTKELAELLRIKERKVYDLAASGEVPCSRAMGKLLFPRKAVEAWIAQNSSGAVSTTRAARPNVMLGSHDPLLDWALRDSRCGLATYFDGSIDGIHRFARGEGIAVGIHLYDGDNDDWNIGEMRAMFGAEPVVLVEWAWRERGLIVSPEKAGRVKRLQDLPGMRLVPRQPEAGSQRLLEYLINREGVTGPIEQIDPARTETDAVLAVVEGRADVAFGLKALAAQHRLTFLPVQRERYDLLVDRRAWFEPPFQLFLQFCRSKAFQNRVAALEGYDVSGLGFVHFNGA